MTTNHRLGISAAIEGARLKQRAGGIHVRLANPSGRRLPKDREYADQAKKNLCGLSIVLAIASTSPSTAAAAVCSIADFGCPESGECIVTGTWSIADGCTLDFADRSLRVEGTLKSESRGGAFGVRAATLTLLGGTLASRGDQDEAGGHIHVQTLGAFVMSGAGPNIDTGGNGGGGSITIVAQSVEILSGFLLASGGSGAGCGDGGEVDIQAEAAVDLRAPVRVHTPGGECIGGEISISGAAVTLSNDLDARGGANASDEPITIHATSGDVTIATNAQILAGGNGQPGGEGASGGLVAIFADAGSVSLAGGRIVASGRSPDGEGGALHVVAALDVYLGGEIVLSGGLAGAGGDALFHCGRNLTVASSVIARGGAAPGAGGGSIELRSGEELEVSATIDASGDGGGAIAATSRGSLTMTGALLARGDTSGGGRLSISACEASIAGRIDGGANEGGQAGEVSVSASMVSLAGAAKVTAQPCVSSPCISIATRSGALILQPGAMISPTPLLIVDDALPEC